VTSFKVNFAVVGAFVLAGIVTLVVALAVLAGRTGPTDPYYTIYANVAGLKFGSQVLFEGYPVGQVDRVTPILDAGRPRFRVDLSIARGFAIPADSVARSEASGVVAPPPLAL
jgi:phospholipid/cholesterol/gamma-HCH transport system substrate-binding protein